MITPSITFDDSQTTPLWAGLTMQDVQELIRCDRDELERLYKLQSEARQIAGSVRLAEEIRLDTLIQGWEHAQDAHWSWYREIADVSTRTAEWPQTMGPGFVGSGY